VLPVISGPDQPVVNQTNTYSFAAVSKATGYQWRLTRRAAFTAVEGAENGLIYFTTNTAPDYNVIVTSPKTSGSYAFHLAHTQSDPQAAPDDQILTYTRLLMPGTNSQIQFKSELGYAADGEVARVQISNDAGNSWQDLYTSTGNNSGFPVDPAYNTHSISLSNFAYRTVMIRFRYDYLIGFSFYPSADPGYGWYIDDLSFSNTEELTSPLVNPAPSGTNFTWVATQAGDYALDARAQVYGQFYLEWGPAKRVTATAVASPIVRFSSVPSLSGGQARIDFDVTNYRTGMSFQLLKTADMGGAWSPDSSAAIQTLVANSKFRFTTPTGGANRAFYRIQAN
jgi:hypothetical protein